MRSRFPAGRARFRFSAASAWPPITRDWCIPQTALYTIRPDGTVLLQVSGLPQGRLPETLPRIGMRLYWPRVRVAVLVRPRPRETYPDCKTGSPVGVYRSQVDRQYFPLRCSPETGSHQDVRWLACGDSTAACAPPGSSLWYSAPCITRRSSSPPRATP